MLGSPPQHWILTIDSVINDLMITLNDGQWGA
jgi:hypothetical protein